MFLLITEIYFRTHVGLEVKSSASANNAGMGVFNEKFHPSKMLLVGTGGIPYEEFLKINPKELF